MDGLELSQGSVPNLGIKAHVFVVLENVSRHPHISLFAASLVKSTKKGRFIKLVMMPILSKYSFSIFTLLLQRSDVNSGIAVQCERVKYY